jgi:hypothetical protein
MDLDPWFKAEGFLRLQGLLGQDFLLSQHAIVDFGRRKLWLAPEIKRKS